ncbi:DedA family protein [Neobacillus sp. D3-1R]|uniref:DedA family protein n=1 Tax=Neobacillus sp. D3-1R TaxID=3445778 RepID=UPI003F9F470E
MDLGLVVEFISEHGYLALFSSFYVCLLGLPIPNEILVMTGGIISTMDHFQPLLTFFIVYLTVILNATILYLVGRKGGNRLLQKLERFKKINRNVQGASIYIQKYGGYAAALSYGLPIMRHCIPFLMGTYQYSYLSFARFSYLSALVWTSVLFLIGRYFGSKIESIGENLHQIGGAVLILLLGVFFTKVLKRYFRQKNLNF